MLSLYLTINMLFYFTSNMLFFVNLEIQDFNDDRSMSLSTCDCTTDAGRN